MDDFKSKSWNDSRTTQVDNYDPNSSNQTGYQDFRSYSSSHASSYTENSAQMNHFSAGKDERQFKKGKSTNGSVSKSWNLGDPEMQRKKRIASYKAYSVEGKVKGSVKKSFSWIKERYNKVVYGYK